MEKSGNTNFDVAIIGCGPAGATLSILCAISGLSVVVLERDTGVFPKPRAVHFDDEVMRIFQWAGLARDLEPLLRVNPGMRFVDPDGQLLLDWPRPAEKGKHGWHTSYRFHQPDLESLLRQHIANHHDEQISLWTGCEVLDLKQDNEKATIHYLDAATRTTEQVTAKYIVGCDGGRSLTRAAIASSAKPDEDLGFRERWLVIDLLLSCDKPELGDHSIQFCHPTKAATYVRGPGKRRRFEFSVEHEDELPDPNDHAFIWHRLARWISPNEAQMERAALYTFHSTIAGNWRDRRIMIAGDAAHQTPPFMGQGMCAGIRDAANLAWKLASVVQGKHPENLLETYESERKPNARAFVEKAVALGKLINASDPKAALEGAMQGKDNSALTGKSAAMKSIYPPLGPGMWAEKGGGQMTGQPGLVNRTLLDDVHPYKPVTIVRDVESQRLKTSGVSPDQAVLIAADHPQVLALLDEYEAECLVLRPDRQFTEIS